MMSSFPRRCGMRLVLAATLAGGVLLGCGPRTSQVELVSYKDPYFPEAYNVDFATCAYRVAPGGDMHVVGRSTEPGHGGDAVTQYLHVHIYWRPHPGRTPTDPSITNALLRYIVKTDEGVTTYAGTGFAYPKQKRNGQMLIKLERVCLHLDARAGSLADFLGTTSADGQLVADPDPGVAAHLIREMDLLSGGHSNALQ